ncbi:Stringent starvation protein B [Arsenophonus endosymbiont of Aleurodicus floccissimus]|uniref:ClpXP protease specificity-enhancing factor n=1 Tax=Arsenophonus endosymbiont of Aleurodicus floccissimus TaxID=2152761 RepID=UPI000E6AF7CD|nr:ClpXP protease specificity-enhancing factor [Arsenophonus endosymbiont of Aleurodicus floccissimus]SPP31900.1 Stringent starvation protein B [Arsenophonus endosymbiont of Aleurodicus floccissimus]
MELLGMSPRRPYLLRAHYEWLLDNNMTSHLVVDVNIFDVNVPMEYANKGQIILNITPSAVGNLELTNEIVSFNARFGGVPRHVEVPMSAIIAIYGRKNGAGMMFEPEPQYEDGTGNSIAQSENLVLVSDTELSNEAQEITPISSSYDDQPMPPKRHVL